MIELFANNPLLLLFALCLCNLPGLIPTGIIFWIARNYEVRNPLTPRNRHIPAGLGDMDEV